MEQITSSLQILEELELNTSDMAPPQHCPLTFSFLQHHIPLASTVVPFLMNFSSLTTKGPHQDAIHPSALPHVIQFRYAHHQDTNVSLPLCASLLKYISFPPHWPMDRKCSTWCSPSDPASARTQIDKLFSARVKAHDKLCLLSIV